MNTSTLEEIAQSLKGIAERWDLEKKAMAGCKVSLRNCRKEDIKDGVEPLNGYELESIHTRFRTHSFVFKSGKVPYPFLVTAIELCVKDEEGTAVGGMIPIGEYRLLTGLDGKEIDSDVVFYQKYDDDEDLEDDEEIGDDEEFEDLE
ncbi:MAG: hypothetical protein ACREDR_23665 [Blastocatellia bacterium]